MPDLYNQPPGDRSRYHWILSVDDSFGVPCPDQNVVLFARSVGYCEAPEAGDLVFAACRGRLVMAARVLGCAMPPDLVLTVDASGLPGEPIAYFSVFVAEVLDCDMFGRHFEPVEFADRLGDYLLSLCRPSSAEATVGDARRFDDDELGEELARVLEIA